MSDQRLLERIRQWESHPEKRFRESSGRGVESVVQHLRRLLNSKEGTTLMDKAFGMPDFTDLAVTFPDSVREIEKTISDTIERYEPRLTQVDVTFVFQDDQNLTLFFQIAAQLETGNDHLDIFLESTIDAGGRMQVRG